MPREDLADEEGDSADKQDVLDAIQETIREIDRLQAEYGSLLSSRGEDGGGGSASNQS